jgi:hypothetical protein
MSTPRRRTPKAGDDSPEVINVTVDVTAETPPGWLPGERSAEHSDHIGSEIATVLAHALGARRVSLTLYWHDIPPPAPGTLPPRQRMKPKRRQRMKPKRRQRMKPKRRA